MSTSRQNRPNSKATTRYLIALLSLAILSGCAAPSTSSPVTYAPTLTATTPPEATAIPAPTATVLPTSEPATLTPPSTPMPPTETPAPPTPPPVTLVPTPTPAPSAQYQLTFEATWSAATHPLDFPPNPHFSGLIGASHGPAVRLWQEGGTATPGIKNMAETGRKSPLDSEIDALIDAGTACTKISGGGISSSPGAVTVILTVNQDCPLVSVVTMIAPSPDWFVGVSGLSLFENGDWVRHVIVDLLPYDAGTDSGSTYTSPNQPTSSPEAIHRIDSVPLQTGETVGPLGTFTFVRLDG